MSFCVAGWSEVEAMNALQDAGVISDNAVWWDDVANQAEAVHWLSSSGNILPSSFESASSSSKMVLSGLNLIPQNGQ